MIIGVDPGSSGAIAFLSDDGITLYEVEDMPAVDTKVSGVLLASMIRRVVHEYEPHGVLLAVVELVGSMPKQGVSSTFKFGRATGVVYGVLGAMVIPIAAEPTPTRWKTAMSLGSNKELSRSRAIQLWPNLADRFARKLDHGRAEAALIGRWLAVQLATADKET